jgi:hypothetical protein
LKLWPVGRWDDGSIRFVAFVPLRLRFTLFPLFSPAFQADKPVSFCMTQIL